MLRQILCPGNGWLKRGGRLWGLTCLASPVRPLVCKSGTFLLHPLDWVWLFPPPDTTENLALQHMGAVALIESAWWPHSWVTGGGFSLISAPLLSHGHSCKLKFWLHPTWKCKKEALIVTLGNWGPGQHDHRSLFFLLGHSLPPGRRYTGHNLKITLRADSPPTVTWYVLCLTSRYMPCCYW